MNIGAYEPTDAECDWPSDDDDELAEEIKDKVGGLQILSRIVFLFRLICCKSNSNCILYFHLDLVSCDFDVRWECDIKDFITNQVLLVVKSGNMKTTQ